MQPRRFSLALLVVVLVAAALTALLPGTSAARPGAQDSPLLPSPTPTFDAGGGAQTPGTADPTAFPEPGRPPPVETLPPLDAPTSVPLPTPGAPASTASGFLPAPTITNPDEVKSLPLAGPPASGGLEPLATATPSRSRNPGVAAAVAALNVLWLICGGALLIGGIFYIILLARRRSDS